MDLRVSWNDSAGIDVESISLRVIGRSGPDLMDVWRVDQIDDSGLAMEEVADHLLTAGANRLELTVADTLGNSVTATIDVTLPHAALHRTLQPHMFDTQRFIGGTRCADDNRMYFVGGRNLVEVSPDPVEVSRTVEVVPGMELRHVLCTEADRYLYATLSRVIRFDRATLEWSDVVGSYQSRGIAASRANPDLFYVGETGWAVPAVVSRSLNQRTHYIDVTHSEHYPDSPMSLAVLPGDRKIYLTRYWEGGLLSIDPKTETIVSRIRFTHPDRSHPGMTSAIALSSDSRKLYAALIAGEPRGIARINTENDSVEATLAFPWSAQMLGVSPDGRRLFVTTGDSGGLESENLLIDLAQWRIIEALPRPRAPGTVRVDAAVVWHHSGRLVLVARGQEIDIYLHRE